MPASPSTPCMNSYLGGGVWYVYVFDMVCPCQMFIWYNIIYKSTSSCSGNIFVCLDFSVAIFRLECGIGCQSHLADTSATRNHLIFSRSAAGLCSLGAPGWFQWPGITLSRQCPWLASWHLWHLALGWYQQTDPTTLGWQRPWSVSLRSQLSTSDSPLSPPSVSSLCSARGTLCSARCKDTKGDTDTHHHWGTQRAMRAHFWPQSFSVSGTKRAWVRNQKRSSRRFVDKDISGFFPALGHIRELAQPTATFYI